MQYSTWAPQHFVSANRWRLWPVIVILRQLVKRRIHFHSISPPSALLTLPALPALLVVLLFFFHLACVIPLLDLSLESLLIALFFAPFAGPDSDCAGP